MLVFALGILARIVYIQVTEGPKLREIAEQKRFKETKLPAERGNIYSEDGTLLSSSVPRFDIRIDWNVIDENNFNDNIDSIALGLSKIYKDLSAKAYKEKITKAYNKRNRDNKRNAYYLLKSKVSYNELIDTKALPIFRKPKNKGGFIEIPQPLREYPYGYLAQRTIGLWRQNAQSVGIEAAFDSILSGIPGKQVEERTSGGVWVPVNGMVQEPINGKDVVTTIDINIQDVTEHALLASLEKYNCQFGAAVVMEVATGKIKAIANLGKTSDGRYAENYNYAITRAEPGSTFKLMTLLSLIDDGYININSKVTIGNGVVHFGKGMRVKDDHAMSPVMTVKKAFAQSSNVAFAKLANEYYSSQPMKFIEHLQKLHLHEKTGIEIIGEDDPDIKTPKSKKWNSITSIPWIAYGYEIMITPIHLCKVYNAVANNGKMMKPYLISEIKEYGNTIQKFEPIVLNESIAKESTIKQLQEALKAVVEEGTAKSIKNPLYGIGGKTGTAQVAGKEFTYSHGIRQGSFVGYFPFDNPKYTIAVAVRSIPHGAYYGAVVAAPVFKTIADKLYATKIGGWKTPQDSIAKSKQYIAKAGDAKDLHTVFKSLGWNFTPNENLQYTALLKNDNGKYEFANLKIPENAIPDVSGMGLRDALYILETAGLNVKVNGKGKVKHQSLAPGQKIKQGETIVIELS